MTAENADSSVPSITIRTGGLDAEQIAAVTAVLTAVASATPEPEAVSPVPSAWNRSQRDVRGTLQPGPGAWRAFSG